MSWFEIGSGTLQQGDILRDCAVPLPPRVVGKEDGAAGPPAEVTVKPEKVEQHDRVIVLSHSCDLADDGLRRVMVAPAYEISKFIQQAIPDGSKEKINSLKADLKKGRRPAYYLLNKCDLDGNACEHLVVDFADAFSIPLGYSKDLAGETRVRVLPPYREHLAQMYAYFYMRVGLPIPLAAF